MKGLLLWLSGKESASNAGDTGNGSLFLGGEDALKDGNAGKEEMATHSIILARKIPGTEEPAGYSPWGPEESDTTA